MMQFAWLREVLVWQVIWLLTALSAKWLSLIGDRPYPQLIELSAMNLIAHLKKNPAKTKQVQQKLLQYFLLDRLVARNANKLINPSLLFPYSWLVFRRDVSTHIKHDSQIILVNHIAGFTLLINLLVAMILRVTSQDIVILYGLANHLMIDRLRTTWIQSDRLHFVLGDQSGLMSLKAHLKQGAKLIALIDIPQEVNSYSSLAVSFLRDRLHFKIGVLRLAATFNYSILPINHHLNLLGLVYQVCPSIRVSQAELHDRERLQQVGETLFSPLSDILSQYPTQWFLWHKVPTPVRST